jgi:hypothetical protein
MLGAEAIQPMMTQNGFGATPEPEARKKLAGGATTGKRPRKTNRALEGREKRAFRFSRPCRDAFFVRTVFSGGFTTG